MKNICAKTGQEFEVSKKDLVFYDKVSPVIGGRKFLIPPPKLSPEVRFKRRIVWRNERSLYKRQCDKTGASIISWIAPDKPYKVYKKDVWWGDSWDARDYGRPFDFNRTFFDQFNDLLKAVPWIDLLVDKTVNSDYTNFCNNVKNCYLVYASNNDEDCAYSSYIWGSNDCLDCLQLFDCQLCYECLDLINCYGCQFSKNCSNCSGLIFCDSCQGCQDCAFSVNLIGKKYCFLNQQLTREEYEKRMAQVRMDSFAGLNRAKQVFEEHKKKFPVRYAKLIGCENCTGDEVKNSKNAHETFDSNNVEDGKFLLICGNSVKDCYDISGGEDCELCYEATVVGVPSSKILFSAYCWNGATELLYSVLSPKSKNSFGVASFQGAEYCILNKQYKKDEYEVLVQRIIQHMQKTGEWGEFFPSHLSPFGYNETLVQDYFPLEKTEALAQGFNWSDYEVEQFQGEDFMGADKLPDSIKDTDDSFANKIVNCSLTGKPFRILLNELTFHRQYNLPLPRLHPDQRHKVRLARRNPRKLWDRNCSKCGMGIKTTYGPDTTQPVYCESCYRAEIY